MADFSWLSEAYQTAVFTAFDTETTGLDPAAGCRVIEIGGISFDCQGIRARFNTLINPGFPIPEEVTRINNITNGMVKNCPLAADVVSDFLAFASDSILLAHNADFDVAFMNAELQKCGMAPISLRVVDTLALARAVFPGRKSYKLQVLAQDLNINVENAHRAEDDARVCMELFLHCLKEMQL